MQWRLLGPFRAGRSVAVAGVPGAPDHYYFGAVAGGVWETDNSGVTWHPIFDGEPIASIGAIAVAPSNPQVIYVGTGEADIRTDISYGDGVYRSDDGGKTWRHLGLDDTRRIGRVVIDPRNPERVWVAALGHAFGPNEQRGVFRSADGGRTWQKVLYRDENTGAIDLALDPSNANTIYAALWAGRRPPWNVYPPSNGYGAVYKSTDGGNTWQTLGGGIPGGPGVGRIGIAVAASEPQRIYAQVDAEKGGVYRSDDGGTSWTLMADEDRIWHRGWYLGSVTVDPLHADVVYVMNTTAWRSEDGGKTWAGFKGAPGGDDYHQLWINPNDDRRMILASDQGTIVSVDGGGSWSSWNNQPTGQFYHVATDNRFPYRVYGAEQDNGARVVVSRSGSGGISYRDWGNSCAGGESGYIAVESHELAHALRHLVQRVGHPLRPGDRRALGRLAHGGVPGERVPGGVDDAGGLLRGRLARALLRERVRVADHGRRPELGQGEPHPHAEGPGRARRTWTRPPPTTSRRSSARATTGASSTRSRPRPSTPGACGRAPTTG